MKDFTNRLGDAAGKVWKSLNDNGSLNERKILNKTKLKTDDFHLAVGWLARENKISKNENGFYLGETNLTSKIGTDAGNVWKILDMWGEVDIQSISRLTDINKSEVLLAIGWLAREGKIAKKIKKQGKVNFYLK